MLWIVFLIALVGAVLNVLEKRVCFLFWMVSNGTWLIYNCDGGEIEQAATYANRRRIKGRRGKALLRLRGEVVERSFAHLYETGAMRRTHLRGHLKILKRLLVHVGGYNLALVMRQAFGIGKPRGLQGQASRTVSNILNIVFALLHRLCGRYGPFDRSSANSDIQERQLRPFLAA